MLHIEGDNWRWRGLGVMSIRALRIMPVVLAFGCDDAGSVVDNRSLLTLSMDNLPVLEAEVTSRLGSVEDADVGFSQIGSVSVDSSGRVYVFDNNDSRIRVFNSSRDLVQAMGGRGEGPGEFRTAALLGVFGDTVWAVEPRNGRVTLFNRVDGRLISSHQADELPITLQPVSIIEGIPGANRQIMSGRVVPYMLRPDGKVISRLFETPTPYTGGGDVAPADTVVVPRVLFDLRGSIVDTIGIEHRPPPSSFQAEIVTIGSRDFAIPNAPSDHPLAVPTIDGRVVVQRRVPDESRPAIVEVLRLDITGDTIFALNIQYSPLPYRVEQLDSIAAAARPGMISADGYLLSFGARQPPPTASEIENIARRIRNNMKFPAFHVPVDYVWIDASDRTWIYFSGIASPAFVILDRHGAPMGKLLWHRPPQRLRWSSGESFWAMELDDLDVQWLVERRLATRAR